MTPGSILAKLSTVEDNGSTLDVSPWELGLGSMQNQTEDGSYYIRINGHLDESWSDWLGDLDLTHEAGGTTLITGSIPDQAALLALLRKLHDLGLTVLSCQVQE